MTATTVAVPVELLVLDLENARLGESQESQADTFLALARQQGSKLVSLARDIVQCGVDPTALPAVIATDGRRRRYKVVEGNRRILALKALATPNIVSLALAPKDQRELAALSRLYLEDPIDEVLCALFDTEEEARHWIKLRHTGENGGVGLVEWNPDEKDRFDARHGGRLARSPSGQVVDFIASLDGVSPASLGVPVTTLNRLLSTPAVRERLGLEKRKGELLSRYPRDEVAKGLRKVVDDLRSQTVTVPDVYKEQQRIDYIGSFQSVDLPSPASRLPEALPFDQLPSTRRSKGGKKPPAPKPKPKPPSRPPARVTVVPPGCHINPAPPRINDVYNELCTLDATTYPNCASVLLRVFLELSVDNYLDQHSLMTESTRRNTSLAKRLKAVADHLRARGAIPTALHVVVYRVADSQHTLAASIVAFHQYVHNEYAHPKPSEIQTAWDELQPFLEKVWA